MEASDNDYLFQLVDMTKRVSTIIIKIVVMRVIVPDCFSKPRKLDNDDKSILLYLRKWQEIIDLLPQELIDKFIVGNTPSLDIIFSKS